MGSMDIEQIFSAAIEREIEANQFYAGVAKSAANDSVRQIFTELARDELGHKELLERFKHDPTLDMRIAAPSQDFKIAEATESPRLSIEMKPADAIALAMKKEQQAVEFYRGLARSAKDSVTREMLESLANMELGHKHRLETVFVDIGYPEAF
jgi:rubrerythrin